MRMAYRSGSRLNNLPHELGMRMFVRLRSADCVHIDSPSNTYKVISEFPTYVAEQAAYQLAEPTFRSRYAHTPYGT